MMLVVRVSPGGACSGLVVTRHGACHADRMADLLTTREIRVTLAGDPLGDLRDRLRRTRLPPAGGDGWERGVPRSWLATLLDDWESFDTAAFQARLDGLTHREAAVDGQLIHLVHVPGRGPDPLPLLLTHGWPGSFCEYLDLIPLLADPAAHGGDPADAFTVVVPSLPGFGFSGPPPPGGLTRARVAALWHRLMTEGLGYPRFAAHGSDLGAGVTGWLARDFPAAVAGIHLATPGLAAPPRPWSPAEEAFLAEVAAWTTEEGGYAHEQATKPSTLGAALLDSPAGLAAWIGEKVTAWSAVTGDGQPAFGRDLLLGTLTLYWVTGTIASSLLPYWAYAHDPAAAPPAGQPPDVPTAISIFGGERVPFPKPPRELAERYFRLTHWAEHDRGGHFPAVAEPALLAQTLRDVFRPLRQNAR
jgi:pimeloyl-ACP methyl ester carboxylesterase